MRFKVTYEKVIKTKFKGKLVIVPAKTKVSDFTLQAVVPQKYFSSKVVNYVYEQ